MLNYLALIICFLLIICLFARDQETRPMTSGALWIVLVWITVIGSRFVSTWFGPLVMDSADVLLDGSPLDRNIFLTLIVSGAVLLFRRRPDLKRLFFSNCWFFIFFFYCGISVIWSEYPFISFKRWIKELGNIIMVVIILTEDNPVQAIRAVFSRYANIVIPISIVLIFFFPGIGTSFDVESMNVARTGVAINKNSLGVITFICSLFTVWDLAYVRGVSQEKTDNTDTIIRIILLFMMVWLILLANSMTALMCLILGIGMLLIMKISIFKNQSQFLGTYILMSALVIFFLTSVPGIRDAFLTTVGRDITLTGRTELWADLWREPINPFVGTGYQSFWLGSRADFLWEKYPFHPIQAHNGYFETYLNNGWIGLLILIAMIVKTGINVKKYMLLDSNVAVLLQAIFVVAIFYNMTEAMFGRLTLFWVILSIAALYQPPRYESMSQRKLRPALVRIPANRR